MTSWGRGVGGRERERRAGLAAARAAGWGGGRSPAGSRPRRPGSRLPEAPRPAAGEWAGGSTARPDPTRPDPAGGGGWMGGGAPAGSRVLPFFLGREGWVFFRVFLVGFGCFCCCFGLVFGGEAHQGTCAGSCCCSLPPGRWRVRAGTGRGFPSARRYFSSLGRAGTGTVAGTEQRPRLPCCLSLRPRTLLGEITQGSFSSTSTPSPQVGDGAREGAAAPGGRGGRGQRPALPCPPRSPCPAPCSAPGDSPALTLRVFGVSVAWSHLVTGGDPA